MNHSVWEAIASTPWWVYFLFLYLLRVGYLATKPNVVPLYNLIIIPAVFIALTFSSMLMMNLSLSSLGIWLTAILFGTAFGWLQFRAMKIKAVKNQRKLYVPGTWGLMIIILILFVLKYYFGYLNAVSPNALQDPNFVAKILLLYGLFTGLFIGRLVYSVRTLQRGPYH